MRYPPARRLDLVEELHGYRVADPYRWLEDAEADETEAWSKAQDELLAGWMDGRPEREAVRERLERLLGAGLVSVPVLRGDRAFFERRRGDQQHPVLLVREADGTERVLIDPSALADDDTITLDGWVPSLEGERLAYFLSQGGDEEASLFVMDVTSGETIEGPIDRTRYCPLAWLPGGDTYYYGRRLPADAVPEGEAAFHRRIWRHRVGTDPDGDQLVFGEGREKTEYHSLRVSLDGRWLLVGAAAGTAPRNDLYIADLAGDGTLRPIQEGSTPRPTAGSGPTAACTSTPTWTRPGSGSRSPTRPGRSRRPGATWCPSPATCSRATRSPTTPWWWRPAGTRSGGWRCTTARPAPRGPRSTCRGPGRCSACPPAPRGRRGLPRLHRLHHPAAGAPLPGRPGAAGAVDGRSRPGRPAGRGDRPAGDLPLQGRHRGPAVPAPPRRPHPDGARPTILYGYGGFNISLTPAWSAVTAAWVEQGGVYAIANLRGAARRARPGTGRHAGQQAARVRRLRGRRRAPGRDRLDVTGPAGHRRRLQRRAAGRGRPHPAAGAVRGRGLQRPLLDMVRYERFGLGETWNDEYGRADDPTELGWLVGYSPYHKVVEGTAYPAVLFTVFDSDTRVDPLHARKMCAALQAATASDRPVLLRRERQAGHGARSVRRTVELHADILTFLAAQVGLDLTAAGGSGSG